MTAPTRPQDTIHFSLDVETVVISQTIRINVSIDGIIEEQKDDVALRAEIRANLRKLVDADWMISNLVRETDRSGVERLSLRAHVRVSEKENYDLKARAEAASRRGLTISEPEVDSSIPQVMIEDAKRDLRIKLLTKVREEVAGINAAIAGTYRAHSVGFQTHADHRPNHRHAKTMMAMTANCYEAAGSADAFEADEALGNAQKIVMTANIILAQA